MRYNRLQALRFFAATSVVLFHSGRTARDVAGIDTPLVCALAHPAVGSPVVLFFALSGFVVTHSLQRQTALRFWLLRAARIFPAYWLVVGVTLAVKYALWGTPAMPRAGAVLYNLLLLPSGPRDGYVLGVEWTLVFEVFFYLVLGLFALINGRRGIEIGVLMWLSSAVTALMVSGGATRDMFPTCTQLPLSAFNLPFLAGAVVYHVRGRGERWRRWAVLALPPLLALPYLVTSPAAVSLAQTAACAIVVWLATIGTDWRDEDLLVGYGDYSYGLYLAHVPVIGVLMAQNRWYRWFPESDLFVLFAAALAVFTGSAYGALEWNTYRWARSRLNGRQASEGGIIAAAPAARAA